jgi:hypothetical protein
MQVERRPLRDLACDLWPDLPALHFSQHLFDFICLLEVGAIASSFFQ